MLPNSPFSRRAWFRLGGGLLAAAGVRPALAGASPSAGVLERRFIYEQAEFPSCHASTIVETQRGLLAAWFGGTDEGKSDVCIYTSRFLDGTWSKPEQVAEGREEGEDRRYPCWNPVLFQPRQGPLLLFYKVGPRPSSWWGVLQTSTDSGRTWSAPRRLPAGQLGPVRAKPVQLHDGTLLCPSSTEHAGWQVQMEFTRDPARDWSRTRPLNRADEWGAIQPTILLHNRDEVQILCRSRQGLVLESWSPDGGRNWSPLSKTTLPNPNAGIDVVKLRDGRFLLIYNHTTRGRSPLNLAFSSDGRNWLAAVALEDEPGEYSYPAIIQARDGRVHATYTWKRQRIRHVVLDPEKLPARPIVDGRWPE